MRDVIEQVDSWVARGDRVALATVVATKRSAPRPPGAKMAINDKGDVSGAVSGGCVEGAVVEVAEGVLRRRRAAAPALRHHRRRRVGRRAAVRRRDRRLGRALRAVSAQARVRRASPAADGRAALVTALERAARRRAAARPRGRRAEGTLGDPALDAEAVALAEELMWAERSEPARRPLRRRDRARRRGSSSSARSSSRAHLCRASRRSTGWRAYVIDPRARFATRSASRTPSR